MKLRLADIVDLHKPLKPDSVVIDCGGYKGDYSQEVINRWNPHITIFEPVPEFYEFCKERFKSNSKVQILPLALGTEIEERTLYVNKDSSSFYKDWARLDNHIEVFAVQLNNEIDEDETIAILKINCEGAEFEILQNLHENNLLQNIEEVLIQFHRISNFNEKYPLAVATLEKTHNKVYDNKWQLWRKK